eukprot:1005502-Rhodomonas_salina.1
MHTGVSARWGHARARRSIASARGCSADDVHTLHTPPSPSPPVPFLPRSAPPHCTRDGCRVRHRQLASQWRREEGEEEEEEEEDA